MLQVGLSSSEMKITSPTTRSRLQNHFARVPLGSKVSLPSPKGEGGTFLLL